MLEIRLMVLRGTLHVHTSRTHRIDKPMEGQPRLINLINDLHSEHSREH